MPFPLSFYMGAVLKTHTSDYTALTGSTRAEPAEGLNTKRTAIGVFQNAASATSRELFHPIQRAENTLAASSGGDHAPDRAALVARRVSFRWRAIIGHR